MTILPLWNPHFPLFWDLENPFLFGLFWFSLCLERKRQGKLVSPEPIRHIADNQERSLPALNQALSHPVATLNSAKLLSVPLSHWSPKLWDGLPPEPVLKCHGKVLGCRGLKHVDSLISKFHLIQGSRLAYHTGSVPAWPWLYHNMSLNFVMLLIFP